MKRFSCRVLLSLPLILIIIAFQNQDKLKNPSIRVMRDTIGFASHAWQMDSIISRINYDFGIKLSNIHKSKGIDSKTQWKVAISPHDDYGYANYLYPVVLNNVKAHTIILFGVCHKARLFGLENQIIFDSYDYWQSAYGLIKVSSIREDIISRLPETNFQIHDSIHAIEHSVEAILPFLQYNNRNIEILPILIPYMHYDTMNEIAGQLANVIQKLTLQKNWKWGSDYSFVISSDAVHYGDESWGGKNFAYYGTDSIGYQKAISHEKTIINNCLTENITTEKVRSFINYTTKAEDFKEYKWTWCGRYSIPFGLLTSFHLQELLGPEKLKGTFLSYSTSVDSKSILVEDLKMGFTAPANDRHWVGYAAVGYK